jgi:hypothetical protein
MFDPQVSVVIGKFTQRSGQLDTGARDDSSFCSGVNDKLWLVRKSNEFF